jgi:hypothetical protein
LEVEEIKEIEEVKEQERVAALAPHRLKTTVQPNADRAKG